LDCDGDTLLIQGKPEGPACQTVRTSCFFNEVERS
ncbi:Phosphoribosyl-AMP cyclohydrolase, partial [human gut metagenome]